MCVYQAWEKLVQQHHAQHFGNFGQGPCQNLTIFFNHFLWILVDIVLFCQTFETLSPLYGNKENWSKHSITQILHSIIYDEGRSICGLHDAASVKQSKRLNQASSISGRVEFFRWVSSSLYVTTFRGLTRNLFDLNVSSEFRNFCLQIRFTGRVQYVTTISHYN